MERNSLSYNKSKKDARFLKKCIPNTANNITAVIFLIAIVPGMLNTKTSNDNNILIVFSKVWLTIQASKPIIFKTHS